MPGAMPADLVRVLDWLGAHLHEPVRLEALAQIGGVGPRTLERHFHDFLRTTPLGWLRRMRLARARRQLLAEQGGRGVTEIALANGFSQLGRFAACYRRDYGELPSDTLRRAQLTETRLDEEIDDEARRLTWRALPAAYAVAPTACGAALEDVDRAQSRAPSYALPKAIAAWCLGQRAAHRFGATPEQDRVDAARLAQAACSLASDDPLVLTLSSGALVLLHRLDEADQLIEQALARDPLAPWAWLRRGWISAYFGEADAAIREFGFALHQMPFEPVRHLAFIGIGCAHFAARRYDRAARWVRDGVDASPECYWAEPIAAAAAAHAGARAEARRIARRLSRRDPDMTIATARRALPFRPDFRSRLGDGLAVAGLPGA